MFNSTSVARRPMARATRCATLAFSLLGLLAGCASTPAGSSDAGDQQTTPISAAERATRSERIRAYFAAKAKRFDVVATTQTPSGQTLDWIHPESQVVGGRLAEPPVQESARLTAPEGPANPFLDTEIVLRQVDRSAQTEVQLDERLRGPAGTVPIVRFDVERYLREVEIPPRDPSDVLTKMPPPAPASNDRYYAVWQRYGKFFGTAGRINVWDTEGPVGNETSIAQTAVIRGDPMQAIEAGKIELQSLNGNRSPHFFTYYRTNGTASGDWVAGYNTLVDGWIQYSARVSPGMSINAWNSRTGGDQFSLDVEVRLHEGNWWVWVAGEWAGYYPHCIGGGATPCSRGTLFSSNGIRDEASRLDWFGEIFDSSAPKATATDMGSGEFAGGWQHAAYFRNLTYFWQPATYWWWDSGSVSVTDGACYNANGPFYSSDANWHNWYFYGGAGKDATGCK